MMLSLPDLWLPILVSAVVVFIASSLVWMVLPHHKKDWSQLPEEAKVLAAMDASPIPAGQYMFPYISDWKTMTPDMKARIEKGPSGSIIVRKPAKMSMAPQLVQWFIYTLVISLMTAYLTGRTLGAGAEDSEVFRVAGTTAVLGYAGALIPNSIWFGRPWNLTIKDVIDSTVYGLLTGAAFCWLWP